MPAQEVIKNIWQSNMVRDSIHHHPFNTIVRWFRDISLLNTIYIYNYIYIFFCYSNCQVNNHADLPRWGPFFKTKAGAAPTFLRGKARYGWYRWAHRGRTAMARVSQDLGMGQKPIVNICGRYQHPLTSYFRYFRCHPGARVLTHNHLRHVPKKVWRRTFWPMAWAWRGSHWLPWGWLVWESHLGKFICITVYLLAIWITVPAMNPYESPVPQLQSRIGLTCENTGPSYKSWKLKWKTRQGLAAALPYYCPGWWSGA